MALVLVMAAAVWCLMDMEVVLDSLLFAKFQSTRVNKND